MRKTALVTFIIGALALYALSNAPAPKSESASPKADFASARSGPTPGNHIPNMDVTLLTATGQIRRHCARGEQRWEEVSLPQETLKVMEGDAFSQSIIAICSGAFEAKQAAADILQGKLKKSDLYIYWVFEFDSDEKYKRIQVGPFASLENCRENQKALRRTEAGFSSCRPLNLNSVASFGD